LHEWFGTPGRWLLAVSSAHVAREHANDDGIWADF
jgi:hypothetical protein